ncbi:MAG: 3-deoxy-manno-octulosonate cytidylyltransferase [Pseudomonadota bacterium]|nr:3-deoxy-manno-octulosonate cytidylyltransferase [Pseudomonadota bacterium]
MKTTVIIPARYNSTRFPGKPLQPIRGVPMLQRVWAIARSVPEISDIIVATDHDAIEEFCHQIGAACVRTSPDIRNGTERVAVVLDQLSHRPDVVINLQGDAVLTPPWVIQAVIPPFASNPSIRMATPATLMQPEAYKTLIQAKQAGEAGGTTVVFDRHGNALYFSKSPIPYVRDGAAPRVWRHIGLYAYAPQTLSDLLKLEPGPLEQQEQLEQLRALENGIKIRVVPVDYQGRTHWGVDSPQDLARAEVLIDREGELLPVYNGSYRNL